MNIPKPNIQILCVLDPDTEKCHFLCVDVTQEYYLLDEEQKREAKIAIADSVTD